MADEMTNDEFEKEKNAIILRKSTMNNDTDVMSIVKAKEEELLKSDELLEASKRVGEERIKADLSAEASRIKSRNLETAGNEFKNETEKLRLEHLTAELNLQHKYDMETLKQDADHKQMLNKRKKLVEKYGYLYDMRPESCAKAYDKDGNEYLVPKDFSYSTFVNKMRQFGRNVSKLDKPILQSIKWLFIIGLGALAIFILKQLGIL